MTSATTTATRAAAGLDKKPSTASSHLRTPASGTFPSEMLSPMAASPGLMSKDDLKTPITPPSAYLDFLKQMSPAMLSPAPTSTSARFHFNEKTADKPVEPLSARPTISPPTSQPSLSRNTSYDSNASMTSTSSSGSGISGVSSASGRSSRTRPQSPRVTIPPSPFVKPALRSARASTPRLRIPQSPLNPSLNSAHSISSPYSSTPLSAAPWSATFAPRDVDPEINGKPGRVSIRQVVTRTVTYCRTPLEPAPKGKRRKIEVEELPSSKSSSEEPPIKQEKLDERDTTQQAEKAQQQG